jgi:hypothetical protein
LWKFLVSLGLATDKALTFVGGTIVVLVCLALFFLFSIYVLRLIELLVYGGAILWLAGGLILVLLFLLYEGSKRLTRSR